MTFEKTYEVKNNTIIIRLPKEFITKKKVKITIEDVDDEKTKKLELLKKASSDPIFNSDVSEVENDFHYSDKELK